MRFTGVFYLLGPTLFIGRAEVVTGNDPWLRLIDPTALLLPCFRVASHFTSNGRRRLQQSCECVFNSFPLFVWPPCWLREKRKRWRGRRRRRLWRLWWAWPDGGLGDSSDRRRCGMPLCFAADSRLRRMRTTWWWSAAGPAGTWRRSRRRRWGSKPRASRSGALSAAHASTLVASLPRSKIASWLFLLPLLFPHSHVVLDLLLLVFSWFILVLLDCSEFCWCLCIRCTN